MVYVYVYVCIIYLSIYLWCMYTCNYWDQFPSEISFPQAVPWTLPPCPPDAVCVLASGRVVSPFILTYSVVPDVRSHEQLAVCARKETIKCTIKSVANATWGVRPSGGHISLNSLP